MAALLRKWKCDVLTAGSGKEMLEQLVTVQRLPDLIVSDFRLRGAENGIEVVEMLRNEFNVGHPRPARDGRHRTGPAAGRRSERSADPAQAAEPGPAAHADHQSAA